MKHFRHRIHLFRLLNGNTDANGGVYPSDERPADSRAEDICINTITMEMMHCR